MQPLKPLRQTSLRSAPVPTPGMIVRVVLAVSALVAVSLAFPSLARADTLRLRGDITAKSDVLTLGDLVENAPAALSGRPMFRAPALGTSGTIQTRRIAESVDRLDLGNIDTGGRSQIQVQRAARRVGAPEIEAALKRVLATTMGLDAGNLSVRLDGEATLFAPLSLDGQANALDVTYDARSHRIAGLIVLGERQASLRVTGQVYETREVAVLTRSLNRGDAVSQGDIALERRPRDALGGDALGNGSSLIGQVAQRSLSANAVLRAGDVAPPDLVQRGDAVAIVFEMPGVSLSMTGIANETGRLGAAVSVTNPASKKTLQATVIGPGRVSVSPIRSQPIVQASASAAPRVN
ncbi:flagellar basal body P-ring formation chaperone FlgA [Methylobacterium brachythecii]|nr:flagellar basal body P-ring formation chaperone FlgA [Methylobacterium brachythecii]